MNILNEQIPDSLEAQIPPAILAAVKRYVEEGVPTGGFLEAVLRDNLSVSLATADPVALKLIVQLLYNYTPGDCWGSPGRVKAWLDPHGEAAMLRKLPAVNV